MTCSSKQLCSTHTCSQSEPNVWLNYMNDERALIVVSYVTMTNCNDRLNATICMTLVLYIQSCLRLIDSNYSSGHVPGLHLSSKPTTC